MDPLVSVILPNYNHARYLKRRIQSIISQSYERFELIILDDCSSDDSQQIILKYANQDKRIRTFFNEHNSGSTFRQWHKGLSFATGEYVWIAESDDFAETNFLAELVPLMERDKSIALGYSNSNVVDENDQSDGTTADWKNNSFQTQRWNYDFITEGLEELTSYLSRTCTINNVSAVLFRRQSIDAVGGVDTSFRYTGDWLMYIKLSLVGRIAYRAACLSNYREHSANASKNSLGDSSQLFERQECFAFIYHSKALSAAAQETMMHCASLEFLSLTYNLLRRSWQPGRLASCVRQIAAVDWQFYLRVQSRAAQLVLRGQY